VVYVILSGTEFSKEREMNKKYRVQLTEAERNELNQLTTRGEAKARDLNRVRILLLADENREGGALADGKIAKLLGVSHPTVARTRRRLVEGGIELAIFDKPRPGRPPEFSGTHRAQVTAIACSDPPQGYNKWSVRLIAEKLVKLDFVSTISHTTVNHILKKTNFLLT
jgi:transposase